MYLAKATGQNISHGYLNKVARGVKPASDRLLRALGFVPKVRVVEVPDGYGVGQACAACGQVHTTKRCTINTEPRKRFYIKRLGSIRRGLRFGHGDGRQGDAI